MGHRILSDGPVSFSGRNAIGIERLERSIRRKSGCSPMLACFVPSSRTLTA